MQHFVAKITGLNKFLVTYAHMIAYKKISYFIFHIYLFQI